MTHGMVVTLKNLKERALYVYLPSTTMANDWKKRAEKEGVSISKFMVEHISDSLKENRTVTMTDTFQNNRWLKNSEKLKMNSNGSQRMPSPQINESKTLWRSSSSRKW